MKALCWCGIKQVRVEDVPEPKIINPHDAMIEVTATAICGSDLHLYDGFIPGLKAGDILGHEFAGRVVDVGSEVRNVRPGDRVVVPFTISCGQCYYCSHQLWALCDNTNPMAWVPESVYGQSPAGIYGYSHLYGGYAGGQAQFVRVPFADCDTLKVPEGLSEEQVLFLSDIFPTGYQAAENCNIEPGHIVGVWGCGPVGQFAIRSALMLGAEKVIAIDRYEGRLRMAEQAGNVTAVNFDDEEVHTRIMDLTGGRGVDACIDAVGLESHGMTFDAIYDRVKTAAFMATDRGHALRQAIRACRKGGVLSVPGVYGGVIDKFPIGAIFGKGLTIRTGQTHVQRYMQPLLERVQRGEIDPTFVITHRLPLTEAADGYARFSKEKDQCIKVVLDPSR